MLSKEVVELSHKEPELIAYRQIPSEREEAARATHYGCRRLATMISRDVPWKHTPYRQGCHCEFDTDPSSTAHLLQPYTYVPLTSTTSTRVFELNPGMPDEPIQGKLIEIELGTPASEYNAVSYAWYSRLTPHPVECDGCVLFITCSLHSALLRLRNASS